MEVECDNCGKVIDRYKSQVKRAKHHFCDRECRGEWQSDNLVGTNAPHFQGGKVDNQCEQCGKRFTVQRCNRNRKYCSQECYGKSKETGRTMNATCEICGDKTYRTPYMMKRNDHFYCSTKCTARAQNKQVEVKCDYCGRNIKKHLYQVESRETEHFFCDRDCRVNWANENGGFVSGEQHPQWRGGISYEEYGNKWTEDLREGVRTAQNNKCAICGCEVTRSKAGEPLSIHHINYIKTDNRSSNLVGLCRSCHTKTNYNRGYWQAFFENGMEEPEEYQMTLYDAM